MSDDILGYVPFHAAGENAADDKEEHIKAAKKAELKKDWDTAAAQYNIARNMILPEDERDPVKSKKIYNALTDKYNNMHRRVLREELRALKTLSNQKPSLGY